MPFGLSLSTVKLIGLAAIAVAVMGLFAWGKIEQADAAKWQSTAQTYAAQRDEAIAANKGLADQIASLTADAAKAAAQAKTDHDALIAEQAKSAAALTQTEVEIEHVAVASDNVCSPSIAAAFGRVCPAAGGADNHPPASR